jgi:hypothetical protein
MKSISMRNIVVKEKITPAGTHTSVILTTGNISLLYHRHVWAKFFVWNPYRPAVARKRHQKRSVPPIRRVKRKSSCDHDFFKCQVPSGDSCVPIYHQVCRKCRWDETKGIVMPVWAWDGWARPQMGHA